MWIRTVYTYNMWKQVADLVHYIYKSSCDLSTPQTTFDDCVANTVTWQDIAHGILKHITQTELNMEFFLPSVGSKKVGSYDSALAVAHSVLVFVQQKEAQEKSFIAKIRRFMFMPPKPLLPLDPPALPHGMLPAEDIRPAWYTANFIANTLAGHRIESSSDGWEAYMFTKNPNYIKETRDKDGFIRR